MNQTEASPTENCEYITLGAGCFWCVEAILKRINGIQSVTSGYMGGPLENPSYEAVCTGNTGHAEVVQVAFNPSLISLEEILDTFWKLHDPTTLNRQGADVGSQYRSAIFYHDETQKQKAESSKEAAQRAGLFQNPIVTEISPAAEFYPAETYHQDFFDQNPNHGYCCAVILPKLAKLDL